MGGGITKELAAPQQIIVSPPPPDDNSWFLWISAVVVPIVIAVGHWYFRNR